MGISDRFNRYAVLMSHVTRLRSRRGVYKSSALPEADHTSLRHSQGTRNASKQEYKVQFDFFFCQQVHLGSLKPIQPWSIIPSIGCAASSAPTHAYVAHARGDGAKDVERGRLRDVRRRGDVAAAAGPVDVCEGW